MSHTTILIFVGVIVVLAAFIFGAYHIIKAQKELLDKRQIALDQRDEKLQEWENLLTAEQKTFENRVRTFKPLLDGTAKEIVASYTVTEADEMKYNTDKAILANAKNRLAMTIGHDLAKKFEPSLDTTEDGKPRYSFRFKVVEVK